MMLWDTKARCMEEYDDLIMAAQMFKHVEEKYFIFFRKSVSELLKEKEKSGSKWQKCYLELFFPFMKKVRRKFTDMV